MRRLLLQSAYEKYDPFGELAREPGPIRIFHDYTAFAEHAPVAAMELARAAVLYANEAFGVSLVAPETWRGKAGVWYSK